MDDIESFFVHIYDPAAATPLSFEQNIALGEAIGSAGRPNEDNPNIPAGFTFLGQFIDHDVTLNELKAIEVVRRLPVQVASLGTASFRSLVEDILLNSRSSLLDLDSVYGLSTAQFEAFVDAAGSDRICSAARATDATDCIDLGNLNSVEARAIAAYELDPGLRLTGRLRVGFRASDLGGPIIPDLPRCSDSVDLFNSPACAPDAGQGETTNDILHRAVIGDPRNDENVIIAQIHAIFLLAHNKLYDANLEEAGLDSSTATPDQKLTAFADARRELVDHWQAIVMDDYLTEHMGRTAVDDIREGPLGFYTTDESGAPYCMAKPGAMPHEFAIGAFRHGHSQVREGYLLNTSGGSPMGAGFGSLFGGQPLGIDRMVDFRAFFEGVRQFDDSAGPANAARTRKLDTVLSPPLGELMAPSIPRSHIGDPVCGDLSKRNTTRAGDQPVSLDDGGDVCIQPIPLLSGLQVAMEMASAGIDIEPLDDKEVASLGLDEVDAVAEAFPDGISAADLPLWVYVLAEAELREDGDALGTVGGTIIGETLIGLIKCDAEGILSRPEPFVPSIEPAGGLQEEGRFRMADLVNFALGE